MSLAGTSFCQALLGSDRRKPANTGDNKQSPSG
jgi:hypothetical protein